VLGGAALGRALSMLLYEVTPFDLTVTVATAAVLCTATALAALLPARAIATADPSAVLRAD
jgi:ABC-type lipoprotein release transport system permease subunit